jgi:aminoglycoside N3'-acetyltransferase
MESEYNKKSEREVVNSTQQPNTIITLKHDFEELGIKPGFDLLMHISLSKIGWTVGGSNHVN